MKTKLYRSRTNSMIGGVCGGLADYLGIDVTIVRLFFVLLALGNGPGVLIYIILWIILPLEGEGALASTTTVRSGASEIAGHARNLGSEARSAFSGANPQAGMLIGWALLFFGAFFLVENLDLPGFRWVDSGMLWPLLLIVGGMALMWRRMKGVES
ncbi:MAG TPA: PspC domain-containing protein [Herpetosiphonaceae bacterium]